MTWERYRAELTNRNHFLDDSEVAVVRLTPEAFLRALERAYRRGEEDKTAEYRGRAEILEVLEGAFVGGGKY